MEEYIICYIDPFGSSHTKVIEFRTPEEADAFGWYLESSGYTDIEILDREWC